MGLSNEEARDKIKNLLSQNEPFSDVSEELMQAKHSIWEQVLDECDYQRRNQPTNEGK